MSTKPKLWQGVQEIWQKEYDWLIRANYPNEILKFITLYECLLAYSKKEFFTTNTVNDNIPKVQKDHFAFNNGFGTFVKEKPITTDLNKTILDLCRKLISTCPQPFDEDSDYKYYDEIKKQVEKKYPASLSSFPPHVYNRFNNPPLKIDRNDEGEKIYIEHLPQLYGSSWSISQKPESLIDIEDEVKINYFKFYFTVLVHSRNWIYHNNKAGDAEPDKLVLKQHIEIMLFMLENWK